MGLLTLLSNSLVPPQLVSASVLSDGVTLRLVFDLPLVAGSATLGFTRSVGSITSGSYSGVNLDLVVPKIYQGDSAGTITYSMLLGTLAGAAGLVSSFGPVAITNNSTQVAYTPQSEFSVGNIGNFWKVGTSAIYQDTGRLTPAASHGDVVGILDKLRDPTGAASTAVGRALAQTTTGNKPTLQTTDPTYNAVLSMGTTSWMYTLSDPQGDNYSNKEYGASGWTTAFRAKVSSGSGYLLGMGGDNDPRLGCRINTAGDAVVGYLTADQTVSLGGIGVWRTVVVEKTAGTGGQLRLYVDDMTTPKVSYNISTSPYFENRMMIWSQGAGGAWRAGFFIDKVVSDRAGLASWLES